MKIPSDNNWTQTNEGDLLGVLNETKDVTLDKTGKLILSKKPTILHSSDITNFGDVLAIKFFEDKYHFLTDDYLWFADTLGGTLTGTSSFSPTSNSDAEVWKDRLYITDNTDFGFWASSSATTGLGTLTSGAPHPITVFDSQPTYKLAIGDDNEVNVYDASHNPGTSLVLPSQYEVTSLVYRSGYLYVGTRNKIAGEARVFVWDGATANANYDVPVGADWIFAMTPYKETIALVTSEGQVLAVSGTSTVELGNFPVYYMPDAIWETAAASTTKVHRNGMTTVGDTIYICIDGQIEAGSDANMPSGLWVLDPDRGLYHRASLNADQDVTDTGLSLSSSTITTSVAHNLKTGDGVQFTGTSGLSGVRTNFVYRVSVVSTTEIKLATSLKSLKNNRFITITGTPDSGDILRYANNTDYGEGNAIKPGPVVKISNIEQPEPVNASPVIWSGGTEEPDGPDISGVYMFFPSYNVGRFTTQKIYTSNVKEVWQKLHVFVENLKLDNEEVIVKYKVPSRFNNRTPELRGTWNGTNQIHSNPNDYDEDPWGDVEVGDELTFVTGYGRGYTAHVTNIDTSSSVYVITVDENIGTDQGICYCYADTFRKIKAFDNTSEEVSFLRSDLGDQKTSWIQIKVEMRGYELEIPFIDLQSTPDK